MEQQGGGMLAGLRVVELSAFVAVPLAGMTLAQLGADVIRVDPPGGGVDYHRWPVTADGASLYWAGLNKAKRSVTVDLRSDDGRDLVRRLITAPGEGGGVLISNLSPRWLDLDTLRRTRPDLISVALRGSPDGSIAVDYTVNAAVGFPQVTGPPGGGMVNHVLPAWDLLAGHQVALAVLAAERRRRGSGAGAHIDVSLSDVAMATAGQLGNVAEVVVNDVDREAYGNYLYGSFGRDFTTGDGRRIMMVALTRRHWQALLEATGLSAELAVVESRLGLDFTLEGDRFAAREEIAAVLEPWFAARSEGEVGEMLTAARVPWGRYQTFRELVDDDPRMAGTDSIFETVTQPGIGTYPAPASPLRVAGGVSSPLLAPVLGADTAAVLGDVLGMGAADIDELRRAGVL